MTAENLLLNMAVADAYGVGFEFANNDYIQKYNHLGCYYPHPQDDFCSAYSDDTQMTIAIMNAMASDETTTLDYADHFVHQFKTDPRAGYASGFHSLLQSVNSGQNLLDEIHPYSTRNGTVMRCIPIAFFDSEDEVLLHAKRQARVTHTTPETDESAQVIALVGHLMYKELYSYADAYDAVMRRNWSFPFDKPFEERVGCDAVQTARAVLTLLHKYSTMADILREAVNLGGDTDSVAAVAIGLASLSSDFEENLPEVLLNDLENGKFGKDYLQGVNIGFLESLSSNID